MSKAQSRHGFTLIELLVVIAIISLLVSILLPSLNKAKDLARAVQCRVQARNYGIAFQMYAEDWDGIMPQKFYSNPAWFLRIAKYLGVSEPADGGFPDSYGQVREVFRCPSREIMPDLSRHKMHYGYNVGGLGIADEGRGCGDYFRLYDIPKPSATILLGDSVGHITAGYVENYQIDWWVRPVSMRHGAAGVEFDPSDPNGAGNVLFADTHAELVPVLDIFKQPEPLNGMVWSLPVIKVP
jgi:prepilin-type N-terminal cleavage/methylation domain-containing protein/prepilin-type processing-associated H-X9-DG protein